MQEQYPIANSKKLVYEKKFTLLWRSSNNRHDLRRKMDDKLSVFDFHANQLDHL